MLGESLSFTGTGTYADAHAGQAKPVTTHDLGFADGIDGTGLASNYSVTLSEVPVTGNVLRAPLNISGLTALNKVYDATLVASIGGSASVTPLGQDVVGVGGTASGSFSDKNVGTAKQVSVSGLSLTGASAGDYVLVGQPTGLVADITPAPLPLSGLQAQNKVYDATTLATILNTGAVHALGDDQVTVSGGVGQFSDKNVGTGKSVLVTNITLSGPRRRQLPGEFGQPDGRHHAAGAQRQRPERLQQGLRHDDAWPRSAAWPASRRSAATWSASRRPARRASPTRTPASPSRSASAG